MKAEVSDDLRLSVRQFQCVMVIRLLLNPTPQTPSELLAEWIAENNLPEVDLLQLSRQLSQVYHLNLEIGQHQECQLIGSELARRLCLFDFLRRLLRQVPQVAETIFAQYPMPSLPSGKRNSRYDHTNLLALLNFCSRQLQRDICRADQQLLIYMLYYTLARKKDIQFSYVQQQWLREKAEFQIASQLLRFWRRYDQQHYSPAETDFCALLLYLLDTPGSYQFNLLIGEQLRDITRQVIQRFILLCDLPLESTTVCRERLYTHLCHALGRHYLLIGVEHSLTEEIEALYPKLVQITSQALAPLEKQYNLTLSQHEIVLIAMILAAGIIEATGYEEQQVILLTKDNPVLEAEVERIVRDLLVFPVTIQRLPLRHFEQAGAPAQANLVVSPYLTQLPLVSPPFIHTELPMTDHQHQCIRQLLTRQIAV